MEKKLTIKTRNGDYLIHGVLNTTDLSDELFICAHGLSGSKEEHLPFNTPKYFNAHGLDVFRFDFYTGSERGRKLETTTVKNHVEDLDQVIKYFSKQYSKIFVAGHSLAGPALLMSKLHKSIAKLILWDPSLDLKLLANNYQYDADKDMYFKQTSMIKYIGKEMHEEFRTIKTLPLLEKIDIPTMVIFAAESIWGKKSDMLDGINNSLLSIKKVPGANHTFDEEGAEEMIYGLTLEFTRL